MTASAATAPVQVSAKEVRSYFADRLDRLPEGVDASILTKRGRLPESVKKAYNRAQRGKKVYGVGVMDSKRVTLTGPKGRKVIVDTATLRALDGTTGKRGRISQATKDAFLASL